MSLPSAGEVQEGPKVWLCACLARNLACFAPRCAASAALRQSYHFAALRRALGQLCAFRDRNRGSSHDDVPVAHRGLPYEKHILAATLHSDISPVALFLAGSAGLKLFFGFEESDGRARLVGPPGDPALDKRHCGLARRIFLFAVFNPNLLRQFRYRGPVTGKPDDCPAKSRLTPCRSQSSTEKCLGRKQSPGGKSEYKPWPAGWISVGRRSFRAVENRSGFFFATPDAST